jgi:antitoxin ParD1/3/4
MGTNVHLTPELVAFAQACVASGRYNSVSEVVRAGLRLVQEREEARAAFVRSLEEAVAEGERDGFVSVEEVRRRGEAVIAGAESAAEATRRGAARAET